MFFKKVLVASSLRKAPVKKKLTGIMQLFATYKLMFMCRIRDCGVRCEVLIVQIYLLEPLEALRALWPRRKMCITA